MFAIILTHLSYVLFFRDTNIIENPFTLNMISHMSFHGLRPILDTLFCLVQ
jgi:hypothetical protein